MADDTTRPSLPDPVRRFTARLKAALKAKPKTELVRLFMDGMAHDLVPDRPDLARWLTTILGRADLLRLAKAFALQECFYCSSGLERCERCRGKGHHADHAACERCLGLGLARCDFCAGSGWVTYNYVPRGLRLPVIVERVKAATAQAKALLGQAAPAAPSPQRREATKALTKELLQLNRLLGVFENAFLAGEKLVGPDGKAAPGVQKLLKTCLGAGQKLQLRIRRVLSALAEGARAEAAHASRSAARAIATQRASLYDDLAASDDFLGSALHRPRLLARRKPSAPRR